MQLAQRFLRRQRRSSDTDQQLGGVGGGKAVEGDTGNQEFVPELSG